MSSSLEEGRFAAVVEDLNHGKEQTGAARVVGGERTSCSTSRSWVRPASGNFTS